MLCAGHSYVIVHLFLLLLWMVLMTLPSTEGECPSCVHGICSGSQCRCRDGYNGPLCDICIPNRNCAHGYCIKPGDCKCEHGWKGLFCDVDMKVYCTFNNPCLNNGICFSLGKQGYSCFCPEGYSGIRCENNVGGPCSCQNNGTCENSRDGRRCICPTDYDGLHCENYINRCRVNPCPKNSNSTCVHTGVGYRCDCKPGQCVQTLMECGETSCAEGLMYSKRSGQSGFTCQCPEGTAGHDCNMRPICVVNTCQNGGICYETLNNMVCVCNEGHIGLKCQTRISECEFNPCSNNGTCVVVSSGYLCQCPTGFGGELCECEISIDQNCGEQPLTSSCQSRTLNSDNQHVLLLVVIVYVTANWWIFSS